MTDPDSSLLYRPCVGIMLINPSGLIWIGRRPDAPNEPEGPGSWWQMPQGGIDEHEDAGAAARRELMEETGIHSVDIIAESPRWYSYDLPVHLRPKAWGGRFCGQRQKWFAMRFLGSEDEITVARPHAHQTGQQGPHQIEFDAWRWAKIGELVGLIVPFKRHVYEQVVRDFAHLAVPHA
jgi:putative (di)nucleoside polyphosphate hydrolase